MSQIPGSQRNCSCLLYCVLLRSGIIKIFHRHVLNGCMTFVNAPRETLMFVLECVCSYKNHIPFYTIRQFILDVRALHRVTIQLPRPLCVILFNRPPSSSHTNFYDNLGDLFFVAVASKFKTFEMVLVGDFIINLLSPEILKCLSCSPIITYI